MIGMPQTDRTPREPHEYEEALERIIQIDDPIAQHNRATDLLLQLRRDRELTDLPAYDAVADRALELVHRAGDRIARIE